MSRYGIGEVDQMFCARLKETLAMRDAFINKHGMRLLIHDHQEVLRILGETYVPPRKGK